VAIIKTNSILIERIPETSLHLLFTAGTAGSRISAPGEERATSIRLRGMDLLSKTAVFMPISLRDNTGGGLLELTPEDFLRFSRAFLRREDPLLTFLSLLVLKNLPISIRLS
jgi:hypothetical protein